jgi:nitrosocyanin
MKKSYIVAIVLVLIAVVVLVALRSKNLEAPIVTDETQVTGETNGEVPAVPGTTTTITTTTTTPTACTMEAKVCPDGSSVGRTGPNCEFAACPTQAVKEFTVSGSNFAFTPNAMTVKKGDKVRITFKNSNGSHDLKIDEFNVNTGILASGVQKTVEFTADKTGSFQYYCSVGSHRAMGMWGTLTVQ